MSGPLDHGTLSHPDTPDAQMELIRRIFQAPRDYLFSVHRWRAYMVDGWVVLLAFNGQRGYDRHEAEGYEYHGTHGTLSDAVLRMISTITGIDW